MTMRPVLKWTVLVLLGAVLSVPLALKLEGMSYQLGFTGGTPGMIVADRLVPPSPDRGFAAMAKSDKIMLSIDAPLCFAIFCGIYMVVIRIRSHRNRKVPTNSPN